MPIDSLFLSSIENNILNNLAIIYLIKKDYNQATSLFMQVIENYQQEQRNEHPELAIALNNLAFSQLAQGDVELALTSLTRGMDIEERNLSLNLTIGSEEEKQAYMNTFTDTTHRAISLHFQKAPDSQDAARLALTTILRRKGRVLDIMANSIGLLRETLTSDQQRLFDQLEECRKRLAMLKFNPVSSLSPSLIEKLEAQEKELEAKLLRQSAEFRAEAQRVEIQDIQRLIPPNSALVELVYYRPFYPNQTPDKRWGNFRYAAYILTANGRVRWVDLGEAEAIHSLMSLFRRALSRSSGRSGETSLI